MKKISAIILLITACSFAQAQNQNEPQSTERNPYSNAFKLSAGISNVNSATGFVVQNEYLHALGRLISLGATLTVSQAYDGLDNESLFFDESQTADTFHEMEHHSLLSVGAVAYVTPMIRNRRHNILVGGGVNLNYQVTSTSSVNGLTSTTIYNLTNNKEAGIGFQLTIGYEYNISDHFLIGLKGSGIFFEETNTFVMASTGYRF